MNNQLFINLFSWCLFLQTFELFKIFKNLQSSERFLLIKGENQSTTTTATATDTTNIKDLRFTNLFFSLFKPYLKSKWQDQENFVFLPEIKLLFLWRCIFILLNLSFIKSPYSDLFLNSFWTFFLMTELCLFAINKIPLNGASTYLTLHILLLGTINRLFPQFENLLTQLLVSQILISYFIAGFVKIKQKGWRNGVYLAVFMRSKNYNPQFNLPLSTNSCRILSWSVILFEISFPLIILFPQLKLTYLIGGIFFHGFINWNFGLSRFFWLWISTYPILFHFIN